jgi:hypothetical protein
METGESMRTGPKVRVYSRQSTGQGCNVLLGWKPADQFEISDVNRRMDSRGLNYRTTAPGAGDASSSELLGRSSSSEPFSARVLFFGLPVRGCILGRREKKY